MQTKDWFHEWLEHYVKPASKQKTYILYCELTEQHILPKFGEMELEGITPLILQRYISELMEHGNLRTGGGLSASSVNAIITVIQSSLKVAYNLGYLEAYTADKAVISFIYPEKNKKEVITQILSRSRLGSNNRC